MAAVLGLIVAALAPTERLPIAIAGFVVAFAIEVGGALLAYRLWRGPASAEPFSWRAVVTLPLFIGYAAAAIAVPLHLGVDYAIPVGPRWWLLPVVWAAFTVLALGAER
ncbi:dienelactone hydrolase, partial [Cryptosporangium phraense]